jgi:hypothetical protein
MNASMKGSKYRMLILNDKSSAVLCCAVVWCGALCCAVVCCCVGCGEMACLRLNEARRYGNFTAEHLME